MRVGSLAESKVHALVGGSVTAETPNVSAVPVVHAATVEGVAADLPDEEPVPAAARFRRAIPIVLGASAVAVVAMFGLGLLDERAGSEQEALVPTTVPPTTAAPLITTAAPVTTIPPTTTVPTTTIPGPATVGAWGNPVDASRLTLKADAIGPIAVGTPAAEAIGQLIASLGIPEAIETAGEGYGLCADEDGRIVRWAELTVIVSGTIQDGSFVGYQYQEPTVPTSHIDLATPSGIRLGDDIATLNEVYGRYTLSYETVSGKSTFHLSEDGELLLWGPISSPEENGRVQGIYSPPSCVG